MATQPLNILCVSTFFKGEAYIKAAKAEGNNIYLLTKKSLEHEAWPWDSIDETLYIDSWVDEHVIKGLAYKFRSIRFDRLVALDDFDVERVALLREHFRMPGMGQTTARYFRDKLAMRVKAKEENIPVPAFTSLFNDDEVNAFADNEPAPWLIKPRSEASAVGIKKIHDKDELWRIIHELGDDRDQYLIEKFEPGDVFHVDSLTADGKVVFTQVSRYLDPPFDVAHGGGIFRSYTLERGSEQEKALNDINEKLLHSFGMNMGASHTEFIRSKATGKHYFLETSSRVGGANLADMVEAASGINLWADWARIESTLLKKKKYRLPKQKNTYAGIVVSLSRFEYPDYSSFDQPEIHWKMQKPWHIGMIVVAQSTDKVLSVLDQLTHRIANEFHASLPPPETLNE